MKENTLGRFSFIDISYKPVLGKEIHVDIHVAVCVCDSPGPLTLSIVPRSKDRWLMIFTALSIPVASFTPT